MWQYYQTLHGPNPGGGEHRTEVLTQTGENPFLSDPNVNKVRQALSNLDFLVVQDIFLTETAEFADSIDQLSDEDLKNIKELYRVRIPISISQFPLP